MGESRLMRAAGYSVETQYYVDDMGRQAAMKALAVRHSQTYQWAAQVTGEREGEGGKSIFVKREKLEFKPDTLRQQKILSHEIRLYESKVHEFNFVDHVYDGKPTISPIEFRIGPPEFPGLIEASVWRCRTPFDVRTAETIPLVRDQFNPIG